MLDVQLPTELVEAFKSTLEEVVEADLLLHVHDGASALCEGGNDVRHILAELGIDPEALSKRVINVFNKADLLDADAHLLIQEEILVLSSHQRNKVKALMYCRTPYLKNYLPLISSVIPSSIHSW